MDWKVQVKMGFVKLRSDLILSFEANLLLLTFDGQMKCFHFTFLLESSFSAWLPAVRSERRCWSSASQLRLTVLLDALVSGRCEAQTGEKHLVSCCCTVGSNPNPC